jgi:recombination protein U
MPTWNTRGLRGSAFEELINFTNDRYRQRGLAVIQKIPTPITPTQLDPNTRLISQAYFERQSTVDYIGVAQGVPLCFDAKATERESLPLQNLHPHQVAFMEAFQGQQGLAFLLVRFQAADAMFLLPLATVLSYWKAMPKGGRKSIPRDACDPALRVYNREGFPVHYLEAVRVYLGSV